MAILEETKLGLGIPVANTAFDRVLNQKINAVKGYLIGAGASETSLATDLGINTIVQGVVDIWSLDGGSIKFSNVFDLFAIQLAAGG